VLQGVTDGLTKSLTSAAVTKFMALFKNIPVSVAPTAPGVPGVPVPAPGGGGVPPIVPAGGAAATTGLGAVAASFAAPLAVVAAGGAAMLGIFAVAGQLIKGEGTIQEREMEWDKWRAEQRKRAGLESLNPMNDKYGRLPISTDPMTLKYTSNIYIGNKKVDTVVGDAINRLGVPGAPIKY
jgi:hypothetical protein